MFIELLKKLKEAVLSSLPVVGVVLVIYFSQFVTHQDRLTAQELTLFLISAIFVTLGMWLFNYGSEKSMSKIGEYLGSTITKKQSMFILILVFFLVGVFVTVAEPDLAVLAEQVPINKWVLIIGIGVGVGIFLVVGALRILFGKSLKIWLLAFYGLLFALACLVSPEFIPLSFDSGGVTTGPITVPFILALGIGIAASKSGNKNADSFGLVAFSSLGPILVVMILSLSQKNVSYTFEPETIGNDWSKIADSFLHSYLPNGDSRGALINVLIAISPIFVFFLIYNFISLKLPTKKIGSIVIGVVITYFGLVLFLGSVEAGFLPISQKLGMEFGTSSDTQGILILIGVVLGIAAVFAEPAVHVLTDQIENVSSGAVHKNLVFAALALGNGAAIGLSILRLTIGFNLLYIVVPGYILAFLLSFFVPDIYFAIAFDSGGVVSGPMNSTFILPYAIGACYAHNSNSSDRIMTDAFGTIAVVAMMPLLTIQTIGLFATIKQNNQLKIARHRIKEEFDDQIIHF